MATPLDVGLLGNFQIIFPLLLIFCITFGVLTYSKIFGENTTLHAMIAIVLSVMTLFSNIAVQTINTAAPWFVILIVFIVFLLLGFMTMGAKEGDILSIIRSPDYGFINWWLAALVLIILLGSLAHVISNEGGFGPSAQEVDDNGDPIINQDTGEPATQENDFWNALFHPKVLGMITLLMICFFAINRLTSKAM